jgi:small subunit ribosomal protein S20
LKKNLSQLKRQRQNEKLKARNKALRSNMRTVIRKAQTAIADHPAADSTREAVATATKTIDKMVTKGLIHKNTAARYKSNLKRSRRTALPEPETKAKAPEVPTQDAPA